MTHTPFHDASQSDYRLLRSEKVGGKLILTIRTDNPEAEVGLFEDDKELAYIKWQAHHELSTTLHQKIDDLFTHQNSKNFRRASKSSKSMKDLQGLVCFEGPGSFTGLRIGLSVANALAYGLSVPIIASGGEDWIRQGIKKLESGKNDRIAKPVYGSPPHITNPRK